jgi:hypothetical protein
VIDGAAGLNAAVVAAPDDPAVVHQHRANRNAALSQTFFGLIEGGL